VELARQGRPLPEPELAGLDAADLRLLRNVPYARHGYGFNSADLQRRFTALGWYHADPRFDNARLTRADADNVALVHSYEGRASLLSARPAAAPDPKQAKARLDALLALVHGGRQLAPNDLAGLDLGQLRLLRNGAYARHGYVFRTADLRAAFRAMDWYKPDPGYAEARLTADDSRNIQLIQGRERTMLAGIGGEALRDFELRSRANAWQALHQ
jgi:hypothetical protein